MAFLLCLFMLKMPLVSTSLQPTAQFSPLQETINASPEGSTVVIPSGVYYGLFHINKTLTLRTTKAVIDANRSSLAIVVTAPNVVVEGFTIINTDRGSCYVPPELDSEVFDSPLVGAGIYIYASNTTIQNTTITNCFMGVGITNSRDTSLKTLNIHNVTWGIMMSYSFHTDIFGSTIHDGLPFGAGIWFGIGSQATLRNCTIENNVWGLIIEPDSMDNLIKYNNFINSTKANVYMHPNADAVGLFTMNYWSDYSGVDLNCDGIGDSFYWINARYADAKPLMFDPPYTPPPTFEYQTGGSCPGRLPHPN